MKETLRQKIETLLTDLNNRIEQLDKYVADYKENDNYEDAAKCHMKASLLRIVAERITLALD
jgi:thiamine phosphate synthase YjbQ (UPF0047 family)